MPKFLTCAHGSVIEAQDFKWHGRVQKSLLHSRLYAEYKVLTALLAKALSTIALTPYLQGRSLVLADMLTTILQDLEDRTSA